jgi:hypothetical protein
MLKLHSKTQSNPVGKPQKFVAVLKGDVQGITATLKLEAETERDIMYKIPLVPKKELEIEINDLNAPLDTFALDKAATKELMAEKERFAEDAAYRDERRRRAEAQA